MTLSFFYHKQSQRMEKIYRKRTRAFGEYEVRHCRGKVLGSIDTHHQSYRLKWVESIPIAVTVTDGCV